MLIKIKPFIIPRTTSQFLLAPGYEKPLLQLRWNTNGDRATWVKELDAFPPGVPPAAAAKELEAESEMHRLAATYGVDIFRKVYPVDEMFVKAFEACQTVTLPAQDTPIPNMERGDEYLAEELVALRVPGLSKDKAVKIIQAGQTLECLGSADPKGLAAITGLPHNLIRSAIEAAKARPVAVVPREAPSAPTELRPRVVETAPT